MMRARYIVSALLLVAAGFAAGAYWTSRHTGSTGPQVAAVVRYQCPMHPNYTSDAPGNCPICGMTLVPIGAPLAPVADGPVPAATDMDPSALPPGTFYVSPQKQQLVGVTYGVVSRDNESGGFRAAGSVGVDETRVAKLHPRFEGWIDRVFADYTGKLVEAGTPLLTIYSPDLLAGQQEYLLALRNRDRLSGATPGGAAGGEALVAAARQRLRLWDLSDEQIDEVARTGQPLMNVTLYAPVGGFVVARNAYPKQRVQPETELYTISDLSRVWVMAQVAEQDAALVRQGMPVTVMAPAAGRTFSGRVDVIQPEIDAVARTLRARIAVPNPRLALRPDMYVDVEFGLPARERLTVPTSALVTTGLRRVVFVDRGSGHLEPRAVETGATTGDRVEITHGLAAGERIVTSGTFLIDSESQLKAALTGMGLGADSAPPPDTTAPVPQQPAKPAAGGHVHD